MKTLGLCTHTHVCVRRVDVCAHILELEYAFRVPKTMKDKFFYINVEV